MSDKLSLVKLATHVVASLGVSKVVNDIIMSNTSVETTADAVKVWTGSLVIGSMITDAAMTHVDGRINAVAAWNEKRKAVSTAK